MPDRCELARPLRPARATWAPSNALAGSIWLPTLAPCGQQRAGWLDERCAIARLRDASDFHLAWPRPCRICSRALPATQPANQPASSRQPATQPDCRPASQPCTEPAPASQPRSQATSQPAAGSQPRSRTVGLPASHAASPCQYEASRAARQPASQQQVASHAAGLLACQPATQPAPASLKRASQRELLWATCLARPGCQRTT